MISGSKTTADPYVPPSCVRNDFFRRTVLGGVGEGIWVAGECEMLVDGSGIVNFSFGPPAGEDWVVENVLTGLITAAAATVIEFGDLGAALANGVNFQLSKGANINNLVVINTNGDFMKLGVPYWGAIGGAALSLAAEWSPDFPLILRGNDSERLNYVINDDILPGTVNSITFWAMARAYKCVG